MFGPTRDEKGHCGIAIVYTPKRCSILRKSRYFLKSEGIGRPLSKTSGTFGRSDIGKFVNNGQWFSNGLVWVLGSLFSISIV